MNAEQPGNPPRIVLIGLPGSGKTAASRALARRLGWRQVDCDDLIVAQEARSIPQIFAQSGERRFREIEAAVVSQATQLEQVVIGTGGGAILSADNRQRLWRDAFVVNVQAQPSTLLQRLRPAGSGTDARPLLSGDDPEARLLALAQERSALYDLADWTVRTDGLSASEVAAEIARVFQAFATRLVRRPGRMLAHQSAQVSASRDRDVAASVRTPTGAYDIVVGWETIAGAGARLRSLGISGRVRVVTDDNVGRLHADALIASLEAADYETSVYSLRPGEDNKTLSAAESLFDWLISERAERREAIVALGGGVVTDLAGFAAATFLRGVPLVHVPTSLLGAVDAAIGGKVAVDHRLGKNLVGSFYQPKLVLIDGSLLRTLPQRELTSGWAEVIKHGLICDRDLVSYLEEHAAAVTSLDPEALLPVLRRSVKIKADVVSADERETGLRSTLNYGHTIGHALEAALAYQGPLHGEAVAVGMAGAGRIGQRLGLLSEDDLRRQNRLIESYGLPLRWPGATLSSVLSAMSLDKKIAGATIRWVMLDGIGATVGRSDVPPDLAGEVIRGLIRETEPESQATTRAI
jgi:shikimate kinase/3-dehydroquinate synthase